METDNKKQNSNLVPPIFLAFGQFPELFLFASKQSKREGLTIQAYIRQLIAKDKNRIENP